MRNKQIVKQATLKERRKKIKEKKAIAIAIANAKKATKAVGIEPKAGETSDIDGENHASNRSKVASRDPEEPRTCIKLPFKSKQKGGGYSPMQVKITEETTKAPVSEKSKKGRRMSEQATPAR